MLIPASHAEHTVESLYASQGREQSWIYRLLLVGVLGTLGSLPFVEVDVSVRARGMVRPATERTELRPAVSGRIERILVRDNEAVEKGQDLVVLASADLDARRIRNQARQAERQNILTDLIRLVAVRPGELDDEGAFCTSALRQEYRQHQAQLTATRLAASRARSEHTRIGLLAVKGIVTEQELENARYEAERWQAESRLLEEQALSRWQERLRDESTQLADLASEEQRLTEEHSNYTLKAPTGGELLGFTGWSPGIYVTAGQVLGSISPDDTLLVETQVASRDVGLVHLGQQARLQVDAYPYTEWGTLDGEVTAISSDWVAGGAAGAPPAFKVIVRPETLQLQLPSGARGELKKGLMLSARFLVARRSLFQLLYDDASSWLNPRDGRET